MTVSVVIGTYGADEWIEHAQRALASVHSQTLAPVSVEHVHATTLADARNQGAESAAGEWLCFLDADDTLDREFVAHMNKAARAAAGRNRLLQPASLDTGMTHPVVHPPVNLEYGNFLIIGTVCRRSAFLRVGGFRDLPVLEDWDLWRRMTAAGARVTSVPQAIYETTVRPGSRNSSRHIHARIAQQIRAGR